MKKHEIIFSIIKIPLDFCIIVFAFFLARELRLITDLIPGVALPIQTIDTKGLFVYALIAAFVFLFVMISHGLYNIAITNSKVKESLDIIRYSFYSFMFFSVIVYLGKEQIYSPAELPRLIILFAFMMSTIGIIIERFILNQTQFFLLRKGRLMKKNIIIINNKEKEKIEDIIEDIQNSEVYNLIGYINKEKIKLKGIKYLGGIEVIEKLFSHKKCDEILYIESDFSKKELLNIWELARIYAIRYRYITNTFDVTKTNTTLSLINTIPVIEIKHTPLDNWGRVLKRIMDIFGSMIGIILFSPMMLIIAILIKLDDPNGPIIYKNTRVGQNRKTFSLYKFRYLEWKYCVKDAYGVDPKKDSALKFEKKLIEEKSERKGPLYKISNDPRKTRIGKIIEKYSLDEIPQLFNVLIGNMSLVGPRPHQPREVKNYALYQKRLLTIKPGMSGMAQVNGREKNDFEKEANLDIFYIENWSLILDLKIILKTFFTILTRK